MVAVCLLVAVYRCVSPCPAVCLSLGTKLQNFRKMDAVCLLVAVCAVCGAGWRCQGFQNRRVSFRGRVSPCVFTMCLLVAVCRRVRPCVQCAAVCAVCILVGPLKGLKKRIL